MAARRGRMGGLEPVSSRWVDVVQELASDPAIGATSNVPSPYPVDGAATFVRIAEERAAKGAEHALAILVDERFVGMCGVILEGHPEGEGEIGYWIGRPYWGRGYATDAGRELLRHCFTTLGLSHLVSSCLVANPPPYPVLPKLGFTEVGRGGNPNPKWGPGEVFALFSLEKDAWRDYLPSAAAGKVEV